MWCTICNHLAEEDRAGSEVIKLYSYSTQLSMKGGRALRGNFH